MNFKSQMCTTKDQSKRLIDLGMNPNTADMHHYRWSEGYWDIQNCPPRGSNSNFIPAWSLHRLMEIGNITGVGFPEIDNIYEVCIRIIASKIKFKLIDPEYINN